MTRQEAARAPTQLREAVVVNTATGILAAERDISVAEATPYVEKHLREVLLPH